MVLTCQQVSYVRGDNVLEASELCKAGPVLCLYFYFQAKYQPKEEFFIYNVCYHIQLSEPEFNYLIEKGLSGSHYIKDTQLKHPIYVKHANLCSFTKLSAHT